MGWRREGIVRRSSMTRAESRMTPREVGAEHERAAEKRHEVILDISFDDQHQIICNRLYMNVISRNLIKYFVGYEIPQDHGMNLVGSLVFFSLWPYLVGSAVSLSYFQEGCERVYVNRASPGIQTLTYCSLFQPRWSSGEVSVLEPEGSRFETRFH
ncbi:hypothetical protein AVEN_262754-1 [Araneus ventricosus]|uniref:Uncharacterized protein n=1 Tax=Araneus ventricosus TaxID=182803 RepID=A0A4Y2BVA0_ARAVE|nr:hypothetical protein AVEN_67394-1 [Araneus ventricosus]GBL96089.1 hypothetical protein AVEN_262754-1 [Araneus ventricosus]